jgi:hypothetical protein
VSGCPQRLNPPETWWCVEVESAVGAARQVGGVLVWQDVLDRAAAIKRLGDSRVPGYTALFRVRAGCGADGFYLVREGPESTPQPSGGGTGPGSTSSRGHHLRTEARSPGCSYSDQVVQIDDTTRVISRTHASSSGSATPDEWSTW